MPESVFQQRMKERKTRFTHRRSRGSYNYLARQQKALQNDLAELSASGEIAEFEKYQEGAGAWDTMKKAAGTVGSGALDILSRSGYASGGAMEEVFQGTPQEIPGRVATELFSGIGGLKGEKKLPSDVIGANTGYGQFQKEHPIASIGTDFAMNIATDPMTFTGGAEFKLLGKGLSKTGKGLISAVRKTKTGEQIVDRFGKSFIPRYGFKRGAEKFGELGYMSKEEAAKAGEALQDVVYKEKLYAAGTRHEFGGKAKEIFDVMGEKKWFSDNQISPDEMKVAIAALKTGAIEQLPTGRAKEAATKIRDFNRYLYGKYAETGIETGHLGDIVPAKINYMHNAPSQYTDLMTKVGDKPPIGRTSSVMDRTAGFEKPQIFDTPEELFAEWERVGIKPEDIVEVTRRNILDLSNQTVNKIHSWRVGKNLLSTGEEMNVIRRLPLGTKTPWAKEFDKNTGEFIRTLVRPGESIYLPQGGFKLFAAELRDIVPSDLLKSIESLDEAGSVIPSNIYEKISKAIDSATNTLVNTTSSGDAITSGPLKKLEEVVSGALEARGISSGEAAAYIGKLRSGASGIITQIENVTSVNKSMLGNYVEDLIKQSHKIGAKIDPAILDKLNKTIVGITTKVPVYAIPTQSLGDLINLQKKLGRPEDVARYWDTLMNVFKTTAIFSPNFFTRNMISSGFSNYIADGVGAVAGYNDVVKLHTATDDLTKVGKYTVKQIRELLPSHGILSGGIAGDVKPITGFGWWRNANQWGENVHREAMFMNSLRKGMTPFEAAKRVKKFHFDYSDLTELDEKIKRYAIPFWTWTKNNIPLQLEMLFKAPTRYRNLAYLKHAVSGGQESENAPQWWEQQDVWQTKFKTEKGNKVAMSMGLPYADLNMFQGNPAGNLGPLSTLINTTTNFDPFLQKPITEFRGQTKPMLTIGKTKLINLPPKLNYAVTSLAPIFKRYGVDMSAAISEFVAGPKRQEDYLKLTKFVGFRLMPLLKSDEEKQRVLNLMNDIKEFRKYQAQEEEK